MRSPDVKNAPPPKKAKLEEIAPDPEDAPKKTKLKEIAPVPEDAPVKTKLEEIAPVPKYAPMKAKQVIDEKYEEYRALPGQEYVVLVELEVVRKHRGSGEDMMILFRQIMRNAGCSEIKMSPQYNSLNFYAKLTPDEAKRLSDLDSVFTVTPNIKWRVFHECMYHEDQVACFP